MVVRRKSLAAGFRTFCFVFALPWLLPIAGLRAADPPVAAASAPADGPAEPSSAEELERPGEVENPFALGPGMAQIVGYVLAANAEARENEELGTGGGVVILQTGVRFGLDPGWEGQVFADTYLNAIDKGPDGDDPGRSRAGLGFLVLRAKVQLFGNGASEDGLALVPFVRFPLNRALTGRAGAEPGLILPFDVDLYRGWEIQGSTGVTFGHGDDGGRAADWETEMSLEWNFAPHWSVYAEPELDVGEGRAQWAMEQGVAVFLTRAWQVDLGFNAGLGKNAKARFGYVGLGVTF
jgi:hypothetical protein